MLDITFQKAGYVPLLAESGEETVGKTGVDANIRYMLSDSRCSILSTGVLRIL